MSSRGRSSAAGSRRRRQHTSSIFSNAKQSDGSIPSRSRRPPRVPRTTTSSPSTAAARPTFWSPVTPTSLHQGRRRHRHHTRRAPRTFPALNWSKARLTARLVARTSCQHSSPTPEAGGFGGGAERIRASDLLPVEQGETVHGHPPRARETPPDLGRHSIIVPGPPTPYRPVRRPIPVDLPVNPAAGAPDMVPLSPHLETESDRSLGAAKTRMVASPSR
jgi:hypothetical protein